MDILYSDNELQSDEAGTPPSITGRSIPSRKSSEGRATPRSYSEIITSPPFRSSDGGHTPRSQSEYIPLDFMLSPSYIELQPKDSDVSLLQRQLKETVLSPPSSRKSRTKKSKVIDWRDTDFIPREKSPTEFKQFSTPQTSFGVNYSQVEPKKQNGYKFYHSDFHVDYELLEDEKELEYFFQEYIRDYRAVDFTHAARKLIYIDWIQAQQKSKFSGTYFIEKNGIPVIELTLASSVEGDSLYPIENPPTQNKLYNKLLSRIEQNTKMDIEYV